MSLYIQGLNLPPKGEAYEIHSDGAITLRVWTGYGDGYQLFGVETRAIEVPPHGRLGDLDAFFEDFPETRDYEWASHEYDVIPADKEEP